MLPHLRDRFELLRSLGEGGMGVVYEAFDRVRGEIVALKTIRRAGAESVYRLKREFRALADLEHPNLVRLHDLFAEGETCFFTMELVPGVDLRAYVEAQATADLERTLSSAELTPIDDSVLRRTMVGLARGVEALHATGLLHRDLKPSNVLVTAEGHVVLLDFGLVAEAHPPDHQSTAGAIAGSAAYMAPEQARGESELTTAADLYAMGVILYELLTDRLPFTGPALRVLVAKQTGDPPRPRELVPAVPEDLDALAMDLLSRDPLARPRLADVFVRLGAPSRPMAPSRRGSAPRLLGRDAELAALDGAYRRTHEGALSIARVSGRSGIGKSALIQAFARKVADSDGAIVLAGRCYEHESVPFKGLDGVVDTLSSVLSMAPPDELGRLLPPGLASLGTLFPVLRRIKPIGAAFARRARGGRSAQRMRAEGFACLRELLRRMGETSPLVVVIDDVQWADEDTARALGELLIGETPPTMLVVLGARPDGTSPVLRELFGQDASPAVASIARTSVELEPVSDEAMRELARVELGDGAPLPLIDAIAREARGIPFAAGELVRFFREGEVELGSLEDIASIDATILRRAETLDLASRQLLEIVAVAGEPTGTSVVLRAAALSDAERTAVDALRVRHFVRTARARSGTLLDTAHDRIREAIIGSLAAETRMRLHHALAFAMESLETPPHDRLARHFAAAGERERALRHAIAAAAEAKEALAFRRAAELYGLAAELAAPADRAALVDLRAEALSLAGRYQEAAEAFLAASELATSTGRRERRRRAAECLLYAGRLDEGLDVLDSVARELGVSIPKSPWAFFCKLALERLKLFFRGLGFEPRAPAEIRGNELERVKTLGAISVVYAPLDPTRGLLPMTRHLRAALDLGDVDEIAIALGMEGILMGSAGFVGRAETVARVLDRLGNAGSVRARAWAAGARGVALCFEGLRNESVRLVEESFAAFESFAKAPWELAMAHFISCFNATYGMRMEPFERLLRFVEEREEQAGPYAELRLRVSGLTPYYLRLGQLDRVFAIDTEAFWAGGTRRDVTFRHVATLFAARAHLYSGDLDAAEAALSAATRSLRRSGATHVLLVRFFICLSSAALAVMRDRPADAVAAARMFGRRRTTAHEKIGSLWLEFLVAVAKKDEPTARKRLSTLRELANRVGNEELEAGACFGLGHLDPGPEGEPARARYLEMIEGSGIVDPDLYFWSVLPIGQRPPRTGETRSAWHHPKGRPLHAGTESRLSAVDAARSPLKNA